MSNKTTLQRIQTYRDFVGELTATYRRTDKPSIKVTSSQVAADFMRPDFDTCMDDHEEFKVLHLNRNNLVVNVDHVSVGSDTGTLVPVKDIVRNALLIKTHGILLFHNHPSSNIKPSQQDIEITKKIKTAAEYFDIKLLDHIILTRESYYSFADQNIL